MEQIFEGDSEWERIYLDLPGFGRTPALPAPGGLPELADWLDAQVELLIGAEPFAVVGNSLGGLLARDLASRRPGQCLGMALLAPVVDTMQRALPDPVVLATAPELLASLDAADAALYAEVAVVQSPENWESFRRAALPGLRAADVAAMECLGARYELRSSPDERLAGCDRPVLIVAGRQDAVVGFQDQYRLSLQLPRATYAVLDGAGHNGHLDRPDDVHELLRSWVRQLM